LIIIEENKHLPIEHESPATCNFIIMLPEGERKPLEIICLNFTQWQRALRWSAVSKNHKRNLCHLKIIRDIKRYQNETL
jgi:hypothetical protein